MLKSLLRVRFAALLAAFTGQSRKRGRQTKGKAAGYAILMLYCFCAFVFLFYTSFSQLAAAFFPAGLGWLYFAMFAIMAFALMFIGSVFTAKSQLFEAKDNELLLSMPVPPGMILLSRMAALLAMHGPEAAFFIKMSDQSNLACIHIFIFPRSSLYPFNPVRESRILQILPANIVKLLRAVVSTHSVNSHNDIAQFSQ